MTRAAFFAAFLLVAPVISLPVTNPTIQDDTKVMTCIAEVISNTVAKPKPLSISQECLEILQGDERIRSILRHQNLLRELQNIAVQGASERTEQQKKNSGFEEELSEVLENQDNGNMERDNQDDDKNISENTDKYHSVKSTGNRFLDGTRQNDDSSHDSNSKSQEMEKTPFQDVEDAKRWNKMDELAKQLTTTKRAGENESDEDPDRSMKMVFKSHNTGDSHDSTEEEARRLQKHHSKEDSEQGFPLLPIPEEKKDEEGSANRRTEDQELESLAAIEAELEKVARKLHALRRG
uniref:Chromogranin-A n=1 Tax=Laticauda laticaudata TaxID=8630 RepID=A0A8C5RKM3_LATLA